MSWAIREFKPDDRDALLNFLGPRITYTDIHSHFQWLYKDNPHGEALTSVAVISKSNELIGCTSVFPRKIWYKDRIVMGCAGGDMLINPEFRRKGIATALHRAIVKQMKAAGILTMYGFPNLNNFGAFRKMESYYPGDFTYIALLLRTDSVIKKMHLGRPVSSLLTKGANSALSLYMNLKLPNRASQDGLLRPTQEFDERFDALGNEIMRSFKIFCVRDSAYLNWRYRKNPIKTHTILAYEADGKLHGFAALEFHQNRCTIFDFVIRNDLRIIKNFMALLRNYAIDRAASLLTIKTNPNDLYTKLLLKCGFRHLSRSYKTPLAVLACGTQEDIAFLTDLHNWHLTDADTDAASIGCLHDNFN